MLNTIQFIAYLYLVYFCLGWFLVRNLKDLDRYEKLGLDLLVGFVLSGFLFYFLAILKLTFIFPAFIGFSFIFQLWDGRYLVKSRFKICYEGVSYSHSILFGFIALGLSVIILSHLVPLNILNHVDVGSYLGFITEMSLHDIRLKMHPFYYDIPMHPYHKFFTLHMVMMLKFTKINIYDVYRLYYPILYISLFLHVSFLFLRRLTKSTLPFLFLLVLFFIFYYPIYMTKDGNMVYYLSVNQPSWLGLLLVMSFLFCISIYEENHYLPFNILASFFLANLLMYKANFYLVIVISISFINIFLWFQRKKTSYLVLPVATIIFSLPFIIEIYNNAARQPVIFRYGALVHMLSHYYLALEYLTRYLNKLFFIPSDLKKIVILLVFFLISSPACLSFLYLSRKLRAFPKTMSYLDIFYAVNLSVLSFFMLFLVTEPYWNLSISLHTLQFALACLFGSIFLNDIRAKFLIKKGLSKERILGVGIGIWLIFMLLVSLFFVPPKLRTSEMLRENNIQFSQDEMDIFQHIRTNTDNNAVVIFPRYFDHSFVNALTLRRTLYSYHKYGPNVYKHSPWEGQIQERLSDLVRLYTTSQGEEVARILEKYKCNFTIVEFNDLPLRFNTDLLKKVFENSSGKIYSFEKR